MNSNLDFYIGVIKGELEKLVDGKFTGNVEFKPNFKDGQIGNCNISLHKSVKKMEDRDA